MWLINKFYALPWTARFSLLVEVLTGVCIATAAAATILTWLQPGVYEYFEPWINCLDPTIPIRMWAAPSSQHNLREVYYLFCFPCYFLPIVSLSFRYCLPFKGRMAEHFDMKKRAIVPIGSILIALASYGIANSPVSDTRGLHIASSNIQLIMFGWVDPYICSVVVWVAGVGLWKSITGR